MPGRKYIKTKNIFHSYKRTYYYKKTQRQHQLKYCKVCKNQSYHFKEGIICKLTDARATFSDECSDYVMDTEKVEQKKKDALLTNIKTEKEMNNASIVMGILAMIGGVVCFFGALIWMNRIFFYPPVLFIGGNCICSKRRK